jgi:hypothetical protein
MFGSQEDMSNEHPNRARLLYKYSTNLISSTMIPKQSTNVNTAQVICFNKMNERTKLSWVHPALKKETERMIEERGGNIGDEILDDRSTSLPHFMI